MFYVALIVVLSVVIFLFTFDLVLVEGRSMLPTFKDGDLRLAVTIRSPKKHKFQIGKIYVFKSPYDDERWVIKRLININRSGELYFVGDNPSESYDSRDYGFVSPDRVRARVLTRR